MKFAHFSRLNIENHTFFAFCLLSKRNDYAKNEKIGAGKALKKRDTLSVSGRCGAADRSDMVNKYIHTLKRETA